ncbi:MAG: hypothetical protein FWD58_00100 [Firmicutes bacterium]|nr:hypothetical protein [Bacillota bacterium]
MNTIYDIQEKIKDMPLEEAVEQVRNAIKLQGKKPDDDLLIMKAEMLLTLADATEGVTDYGRYHEAAATVKPLLKRKKKDPYYPHLLHMAAYALIRLDCYCEAEPYALEFYETHYDDTEAAYLAAHAYQGICVERGITDDEPQKGLRFIDEYLKTGDFLRGASVKVDLLVAAGRFDEALDLLDFCAHAHPEHAAAWTDKRISYHVQKGENGPAFQLADALLDQTEDKDDRERLFFNIMDVLLEDKSAKERKNYVKRYAERFPLDISALCEYDEYFGAKEWLALLENAYALGGDIEAARELLWRSLRGGTKKDVKRCLEILEGFVTDDEPDHWSAVQMVMYGAFYKYDTGQCVKILEKDLLSDPNRDCTYTMLGKLHECGIGVPPDPEKAFSYYELAHLHYDDSCGCGALFCAYAYYFGIGTPPDKEKAKNLLLECMRKRGKDSDQDGIYAMMAFEGDDARFDRARALKALNRNTGDPSAAFLLWKYTSDEKERAKYLKRFKKALSEAGQLEKDTLQKYLDHPELPFIPFIRT